MPSLRPMSRTRGLLAAATAVVCVLATASPGAAASRLKVLKVSVANPTDDARAAENVVLRIADLKAIAPDFLPTSFVVTATDAGTVEQDAAVLAAQELPSQADDVDGDGTLDEIAFQVALAPRQTRIVTVSYGPFDSIGRLRTVYPSRTAAGFSKKYEGAGWESEIAAWRLYFDARNAVDLFGKRRPGLQLETFAAPEYDYHAESPYGRDIYKNGNAIGIGSAAAWVDGAVAKVAEVRNRTWTIVTKGPVRSILELRYEGWTLAARTADLTSRIVQWAGERGFEHHVHVAGEAAPMLVTGLPIKPGLDAIRASEGSVAVLATWGPQVLEPGREATASLPDQKLGLAALVAGGDAGAAVPASDELNHLQAVPLSGGRGRWYVYGAWDQEGTERLTLAPGTGIHSTLVLPPAGLTTREAFLSAVKLQARVMGSPASVTLLSKQAGPQSAPPSTLAPARSKTFREAIGLLRGEAARTATKWLPSVERPGNDVTREEGTGFFTDADNVTGEWRPRTGYFWTGGFWVGSLWRHYEETGDARFRTWAEAWNAKLLGKEPLQNHDVGFLNYYSSVLAYERTKDPKYREAGLRAAERLKKLFNPQIDLIASWEEMGNDTIIDTMMNLEIWWWAARTTGDASWRELGRRHAKKTLQWLTRPDGSTVQSVHYNPGNNTQTFRSSRTETLFPNSAKPGEWVFKHTHQGWAADTTWTRGATWAIYGFVRAYQETREPAFLDAARRTADYVLDRLPEDGVPWYDLHDEGIMFRNRDASAAAILAKGLLLLADALPDPASAESYRAQGRRITQSLVDRYLTPVAAGDKTPPGLLRHACWTRPMDGPLVYGQYYLLEALLHLEPKGKTRPPAR
jgi:unsaturated chondroitin disaccharide hydrolase